MSLKARPGAGYLGIEKIKTKKKRPNLATATAAATTKRFSAESQWAVIVSTETRNSLNNLGGRGHS
jgi:hypothetical protein